LPFFALEFIVRVTPTKGVQVTKLLTPDDLASKPDFFEPAVTEYDHSLQRNLSSTPLMTGMGTPTFNGTQTFNHSGQPTDSDQDNDRSS
jgi:hypothetical protein